MDQCLPTQLEYHLATRRDATAAGAVVYVVDDDAAVRASLQALLESADYTVFLFGDASTFLATPIHSSPACLLLDVRMPNLSGLDLQIKLRTERPGLPIIFMTGFATIPMTVQAIKSGAHEFLSKPLEPDDLLAAVASALDESRASFADDQHLADLQERHRQLTPREREVFSLVITGLMNKQLAHALGTTEITAKVHKRRVMEKMRTRTVIDLARMAETLGVPARTGSSLAFRAQAAGA